MHIYMMTRGIKHAVDRFINELSAKYLPYKYKTKKMKKFEEGLLQVAVRPIQLWEICFPEEHQEIMMNTLFESQEGKTQHKKHNKFVYALRKILGIEKPPKYKYQKKSLPVYREGVEKVCIGVKKDRYQNGVEMI